LGTARRKDTAETKQDAPGSTETKEQRRKAAAAQTNQDGDLKVATKTKTKEEALAKLALFDDRPVCRLCFGRNEFADVENFYGNCQAG